MPHTRKFLLVLFFLLSTSSVFARSPEFYVPDELRPRVDFWIDVFTRYNKNQVIVHHRDFPQVVFGIIDFRSQSEKMSPKAFAKYREKTKKEKVRLIEGALKYLGTGKSPKTSLQKLVKEVMRDVPGSTGKYRKAYQEHLVRTQTGIRDKFEAALKRSGRYMHILIQIFSKHGLPVELTRLPFVESSFDYRAYSSAGAAGIWQFMPRTGRSFGMRVDRTIDERRDIVSATNGAAKYLKQAYKSLGTWPLALTSYNHGVAGVKRKVKKLKTNDIVKIIEHPYKRLFGFASTNFYPEFLAALEVYDNYDVYFPGLKPELPRHITGYRLPHSFSAKHVIKTLGVSEETLKEYNYAIGSRVWSGNYDIPRGYVLKLPASLKTRVSALTKPEKRVVVAGANYVVRKGDTLSTIARRHGINVSTLKKINHLRTDRIYVGQRLKVSMVSAKTYIVRRGDTLSAIAARHRMSTTSLKKLNRLSGSRIYVGQKLKVSTGSSQVARSANKKKVTYHTVRRGDALWKIARKYNTSISSIKKRNNLRSDTLRIGQKLRIF